MTRLGLRLLAVACLLLATVGPSPSQAAIASADLPLEARDADGDTGSQEDDLIATSYVLPNQIFNDGKPYYASKDPISGQLDFNAKKPAGIETAANEVVDPKEKIVLSSSSPNIHDFLNLPVKYSSSKFVYPLVSSSYANLKYQGNNKNFMTNKKPTSVAAPATPAPGYQAGHNYYTVPTTKLMAVPPTAAGTFTTSSTTTTTTTTTSKKPTTVTKTTPKTTTMKTTTTPPPPKSTTATPPKYTTSTRRPAPASTTTPAPRTTTTRKKFVPTKKYSPTTTAGTSSTPMRFPTERPTNGAPRPSSTSTTSTSTTTTTTTRHPTPQSSSAAPTRPSTTVGTSAATSTTPARPVSSTSRQPIVFTEDPSAPPTPTSFPGTTRVPNLDPADVYQTLGQKNTQQEQQQHQLQQQQQIQQQQIQQQKIQQQQMQQQQQQMQQQQQQMQHQYQQNQQQQIQIQQQQLQHQQNQQSMTLADIFNSLAEEESALAFQNQGNQGFDAQGNLIQPIAPSKPSPFAMQHVRPQQTATSARPATFGTTPQSPSQSPQSPQMPQFPPTAQTGFGSDQKVISGSQENYSNEYVSYQVQQPNVMQYRPAPGAINNVVISPGQNSATFVLGSQQQVGANAFGSVEKEPLFSKEPPVQYGTVINEDIGPLKRPGSGPSAQGPASSNFHQNGNFGHAPSGPAGPYNQRPAPTGSFQDAPPAPPSPYQQLPLVGTNRRPQAQAQTQSQPQQPHPQQPHQQQSHQQQSHPNYSQSQSQQGGSSGPSHDEPHPHPHPSSVSVSSEQQTQELLVSTNIRFPANDDQSDELSSNVVASGPPTGPQVNGHAQPLSLQQIQNSNPVVFPKAQDEAQPVASSNEIHNGGAIGDIQIQKHEVLTMNQHKNKLNFPQSSQQPESHLSSSHVPSQHMEPPPRFQPTLPGGPAPLESQELHKRPRPHSPQQQQPQQSPPPAFLYNEYTRKPIPGISRPNPDRHLPNILPQFRPNAKISSGHPPAFTQEPGNIRIGGAPQGSQTHKHPSPQFAHRRQPMPQHHQQQQPMPGQRYPMKRISEFPAPPPAEANRRVYRLPPYGGQYVDHRTYARRPLPQTQIADSYAVERHAPPGADPYTNQMSPMMPLEKLAAFEEEDLVINDPPQPVTPSPKDHRKPAATAQEEEQERLEPVVTLQMLQSQKKAEDNNGSGEIQVEAQNAVPPFEQLGSQSGLYVVYPMKKGAKDVPETAESKDPLPAVAHVESAAPTTTGSEYQNTPFSVLRDQPQEPILMVKNKKPQSMQMQQQQAKKPQDKFPYPIEKPDPSFSELNVHHRVPGVLIAPRIVNGAHGSGTEAPIAIAYTPTEPNPFRRNGQMPYALAQVQNPPPHIQNNNKYSNVNLASAVISEIRPAEQTQTQTQTEEGLSNDFDLRGQNYEKDFMAPFYPSVSLGGTAAKAPSNGWNILPSTSTSTDSSVYEKNNINRADVTVNAEDQDQTGGAETTTPKSFELDSFQPELQGGFKPIYPPGYKVDDEEADNEEEEVVHLKEGHNMPVAMASRMDPPTAGATTSTSSTTSTTRPPMSSSSSSSTSTTRAPSSTTDAPTTPRPTQRKKSAFETSLEALLFGDDEDFELPDGGEARKESPVKKAISGPRSYVPRSGPRSLRLR